MPSQRGFTYLGVLLAVAILGIALVAASQVWVMHAHRQRLEQLEWVAQQYIQSIGSYYEGTPGREKRYPKALTELLEDTRFVTVRRHLRQVYVNPMTGTLDWRLLKTPDGGIRGIAAEFKKPDSQDMERREYAYLPGEGGKPVPPPRQGAGS